MMAKKDYQLQAIEQPNEGVYLYDLFSVTKFLSLKKIASPPSEKSIIFAR